MALCLRLEGLSLLSLGTWDSLKIKGFKVRSSQEELDLDPSGHERSDTYPLYYQTLAIEALDEGIITEGRFAEVMGVGLVEARRLAEELRKRSSGMDEGGTSFDLTSLAAA